MTPAPNPTLRRWIDIIAYAALASAIVLLVARRIARFVGEQGAVWGVSVATNYCWAVIGGAAIAALSWRSRAGFLGLRHLYRYPPIWLSSVLGFLVVAATATSDPALAPFDGDGTRANDLWWPLAILAAGLVGPWLHHVSWPKGARKSESRDTPYDLLDAIRSDRPINWPTQDWFNAQDMAARIAERLRKPWQNDAASIAVNGELGSGKTSVRKLVEQRLGEAARGESPIIVSISLWPYENAAAAVEAILSRLIEAIGEHVNTIALRSVPQAYVSAAEGLGDWLKPIAGLLGSRRAPGELVREIDAIACAIDRRFVLWIEDLERFAGGVGDALSHDFNEAVAPIRALLHEIGSGSDDQSRCRNIAVVLASKKLDFDIDKVARYVEHIPRLAPRQIAPLLQEFRERCHAEASGLVVERATRQDDIDFSSTELPFSSADKNQPTWTAAAANLLRTPRALKNALRHCLDVWDVLKGEIDFDDLMAISILRYGEPEVFEMVVEHIAELRGDEGLLDNLPSSNGKAKATSFFEIALNSWTAHTQGEALAIERRAAVVKFTDYLFPRKRGAHGRLDPQRLASDHVYWDRYMRGMRVDARSSDQRLLKLLKRAEDDGSALADIGEYFEDAEALPTLARFGARLTDSQATGLFASLIEKRAKQDPSNWPNGTAPGLNAAAGILYPRGRTEFLKGFWNTFLPGKMIHVVADNLVLLKHLEHVHAGGVADTATQASVHSDNLKAIFGHYAGKPESLAMQLSKMSHLLSLLLRNIEHQTVQPYELPGWVQFADTVLDMCRTHPELLIQVAPLLTEGKAVSGPIAFFHEYSPTKDDNWFGGRALTLFESQPPRLEEREYMALYNAANRLAAADPEG